MIEVLEGVFDADALRHDFEVLCLFAKNREPSPNLTQLSVYVPEGQGERDQAWGICNGTNWDFRANTHLVPEDSFTEILPILKGSYTEVVVSEIRKKYPLGRIRFLTLEPKTCLSWHRDREFIRLHIPVITNDASFFVQGKSLHLSSVGIMPAAGCLYELRTNSHHTAVNPHLSLPRTHLVLNVLR